MRQSFLDSFDNIETLLKNLLRFEVRPVAAQQLRYIITSLQPTVESPSLELRDSFILNSVTAMAQIQSAPAVKVVLDGDVTASSLITGTGLLVSWLTAWTTSCTPP